VQHSGLFKKVGEHITQLNSLISFTPQALANTAWAYATIGVQHPDLFDKVGHHIVALKNLKSFNPQILQTSFGHLLPQIK
jgi:hypothetical protein